MDDLPEVEKCRSIQIMSEEQANIVGSNLRVIYPESEYYEDPQSKAIDATKTKISQTVTLL